MLIGYTPFKGETRDGTFENILNQKVQFPDFSSNPYYRGPGLSSHSKSFIRKLLNKNEKKRLGAHAGASQVKSHPFFKGINFALLRHTKPPIIPVKTHPIRAVHFNHVKESTSFDLSQDSIPPTPPLSDDEDGYNPFQYFNSGKRRTVFFFFGSNIFLLS
jgi:serine/threonine protein kinase